MATLRLNVDPTGAVAGAAKAKTAIDAIKAVAMQAEAAVGKAFRGIGSAASKAGSAIGALGRMTGQTRFVVQNAANQLGDMAVQIGMGTSAIRAMGLQLPQLLGGFSALGGAVGAVLPILGAVAAIGLPIAAAFLAARGGASDFEDQLESIERTTDSLLETMDILKMDAQELGERYGDAALAVREFAKAQAELRVSMAEEALKGNIDGMADTLAMFAAANRSWGDRMLSPLVNLGKEIGLTIDQTEQLGVAFQNIRIAEDFDASKSALQGLIDLMDEYGIEASDLPPEIQQALDDMISLTNATIAAQAAMEALTGAASDLAQINVAGAIANLTMPGFGTGSSDAIPDLGGVSFPSNVITLTPPKKTSGGGAAKSIADQYESLRSSLDETYRAARQYEDAQELLNKALAAGEITAQEYSETLALAKEKMNEAGQAASEMQGVFDTIESSMENAFMSMIDGTMSAKDAFRSMARDIIAELYRVLVVQQLVGSFDTKTGTGSGIVGFIGGLFGGARAGGGPVEQGKTYLVGEKGPELFTPSNTGSITSNNRMGGDVIVQQTIQLSAGVPEAVQSELVKMMPRIVEASKAGVLDARRRGGEFKRAFV